tara:strand:- start:43 stop:834 length:792 start_codon:yes stop_codon:yes gene_type:complete
VKISLIPGFNPGPFTGSGNNTYLISGSEPALIDAATGSEAHLKELKSSLGRGFLSRVLITHGHNDHVSGVTAISKCWPNVECIKIPWRERDKRYEVKWKSISDGDEIRAGDCLLRVIFTPGHAPDHAAFFEETSKTLFCGDLMIKGSTTVIPARSGGSLLAYMESLQAIIKLDPLRVLPAHGPEIENPILLAQNYLDHRRKREGQIISELKNGCATLPLLVDRIYSHVSSNLVEAASETVLAHLEKLEIEGLIAEKEGEWHLI